MTYPQNEQNPVTLSDLPPDVAAGCPTLLTESKTYRHAPLFTVADGAGFRHLIPGRGTKNLFLKDKKENLWLLTAWEDSRIDLNGFSALLREKGLISSRFSFASADRLQAMLGVTPGSVTPLALMNDHARRVNFALDAALFDAAEISCHPLRNDMTTVMPAALLRRIVENWGYRPLFIDFSAEPPRSVEGFDDKMD